MRRDKTDEEKIRCKYPVENIGNYVSMGILFKDEIDEVFYWPIEKEILFESEFTADYVCIKYPQYFRKHNSENGKKP